jgi:ABC-type transport system substrate-binding protein
MGGDAAIQWIGRAGFKFCKYVPCIAEVLGDANEDGTRWVFHLRRDVEFHSNPCFGVVRHARIVTAA